MCRFGAETAVVVERYDRTLVDGHLVRVHQEDLCQVLGLPPTMKYENGRRPRLPADRSGHTEALRPTRPGCPDLRTGTRVELDHRGDRRPREELLSSHRRWRPCFPRPLYDVASLRPYPGHYEPKLKLAMKIGGEARLGYTQARHWTRLARDVGLAASEVLESCASLAAAISGRLPGIVQTARNDGLDHPILDRLEEAILARAEVCRAKVG